MHPLQQHPGRSFPPLAIPSLLLAPATLGRRIWAPWVKPKAAVANFEASGWGLLCIIHGRGKTPPEGLPKPHQLVNKPEHTV